MRLAAVALSVYALGGCGKKGPPSGGPPDIEPPRLVASHPDSGAAHVRRDARLSLVFSEGMEPRSTGDAVLLAPETEFRSPRWQGRTMTLVPVESLRAGQTYTLFVAATARDRHGNPMAAGRSVVFTTADSLPPGRIEGTLDARGFNANGTYLWCYRDGRSGVPDSTGRDVDALAIADIDGHFRLPGLPVPGRYRLWAFADLNRNRSFEPPTDVLDAIDTVFSLTREQPAATGSRSVVLNPHAPGRVRGTVLDSLRVTTGKLLVLAMSVPDSSAKVGGSVNERFEFNVELDAGAWRVRAFRDADNNGVWDRAREPASDPVTVDVRPAGEVQGLVLVLRWRPPSER